MWENGNQAPGKTWDVLVSLNGFTNATNKDPTWTNTTDYAEFRSTNEKKWLVHRKSE